MRKQLVFASEAKQSIKTNGKNSKDCFVVPPRNDKKQAKMPK